MTQTVRATFDAIERIVNDHQGARLRFEDGHTCYLDCVTAGLVVATVNRIEKAELREKVKREIGLSSGRFAKVVDIAYRHCGLRAS